MRIPSVCLLAALVVTVRAPAVIADDEVVGGDWAPKQAKSKTQANAAAPQEKDEVVGGGWSATPEPSPEPKPTAPANETAAQPVSPATEHEPGNPSTVQSAAPGDGPEVEQVSRDAQELARRGNGRQARALLAAALELHPADPTLTAAAKLIDKEDLQGPAQNRVAKAMREALRILGGRKSDLERARGEFAFVKNLHGPEGVQAASVLPLSGVAPAAVTGGVAGRLQPLPAPTPGQNPPAVGLWGTWTKDLVRMDRMGDYAGALALIDRHLAAVQDPSRLRDLRKTKASQLAKAGRYADAEREARALLADRDDATLRGVLSFALTRQGRPAEGLAQAHRAVALDPRNTDARLARADAYFALGDDKEGLHDLYVAGQIDSGFQELFRTELRARTAPPATDPIRTVLLVAMAAMLAGIGWQIKRLLASKRQEEPQPANTLSQLLPVSAAAPAGYEIDKELGRGGMGVVYQARDLRLGRTVAVKRMRPELSSSPKDRERFVNEGRLVAGLRHPNIMQIYEVGADAGGLYSVLEYIPGYSLVDDLDGRPMRPAEAIGLLRQIAAALDYAHGEGVVHQDLKPSNIMLSGLTVKVVDFGIARHVEDTFSTLTHARGTPAYMAPEQELRAAPRPAADVWSLGAIAYEMLTGARAFGGSLDAKRARLYRPASQVKGDLSAGVDGVLAKCLDPEPMGRWPGAGTFVLELAKELSLPAA